MYSLLELGNTYMSKLDAGIHGFVHWKDRRETRYLIIVKELIHDMHANRKKPETCVSLQL
jgi:hypothetical protein